jgi:hypothetical protein
MLNDLLWGEYTGNGLTSYSYREDHLQPSASDKLGDDSLKKVPLNLSNTLQKSMVSALSNSAKKGRRPSRNATSSSITSSVFKYQYNATMASDFLSKNGMEILVISHTFNDHGFRKVFENKNIQILSVFSASSFCGSIWNKGNIDCCTGSNDVGATITFTQGDNVNWRDPVSQMWPHNVNKAQLFLRYGLYLTLVDVLDVKKMLCH